MTVVTATAVMVLVVWLLDDHRRWRRPTGAAAGLVVLWPAVAIPAVVVVIAVRRRRQLAARRRAARAARRDEVLLAHALLVALSGGLTVAVGLHVVRDHLAPGLAESTDQVLRRATSDGLGAALQAAEGPGARLFHDLGAAHASGAPLVVALGARARELHERSRTEALQAARQLPVKMTFPLTLLMVPGFVILTIGPTIVSAFRSLFDSVGGL